MTEEDIVAGLTHGLLIQRLVTGIALLHNGMEQLKELSAPGLTIPEITGSVLGLLVLVGLWTPVTGTLVAAVEVWILFAGDSNPWVCITLATMGGTLAMIGPGYWSVDARLFGRKHISGRA